LRTAALSGYRAAGLPVGALPGKRRRRGTVLADYLVADWPLVVIPVICPRTREDTSMSHKLHFLIGRETANINRLPSLGARCAFALRGFALGGLALLAGAAGAQVLPGEHSLLLQYLQTAQTSGSAVSDITSGDIDQDGDLDVLSADVNAGVIRLLINNGASGFTKQTLNPGVTPSVLALGDVDSDGDLDLAVGFNSGMRWLRNDGAGHFMPVDTYNFPAGDASPTAMQLADVNHDRQLDAVLGLSIHPVNGGGTTGGLWVALGDGAGNFVPLATHELALSAVNITLADFNADGHVDVAELGGYISASAVSIASGLGDGTFVNDTPTFGVGIYAGGLCSGDFNGDGVADLATGFKYNMSIRLNDGTGNFTLAQSVAVGSYVKGIAAGDLDRDGDLDLLATSGSSSAIRLVTNDGTGYFTITATVPASVQCYSVLLADTSGDGYLDAWAGDVTSGQLFTGSSQCLVARYDHAKPNSLGAMPAMDATGTPSVSGSGFTVLATKLLPLQPGFLLVGLAPTEKPAYGGLLLIAPPLLAIAVTTSAGSGIPGASDATVIVPITGSQLGAATLGTRLYMQLLSRDPGAPDGTSASLTDGLWFEIVP